MSTVKRTLANFSFYDQEAIEKQLEQMAARGWRLRKPGSLFWVYEKTNPQKLRFCVTYFPGASELDPRPSERQLEKEDFCAQDGWTLVARWDSMVIFCTDKEDAVPIDTDPIPHVENLYRTMRKKLLSGSLAFVVMILWFLFIQFSQFWRDPADYLSDRYYLFSIPFWLVLLMGTIWEIIVFFRWQHRARIEAKRGVFLPVHSNRWFSWGIVVLGLIVLLLSFANIKTNFLFTVCFFAIMAAIFFLTYRVMYWMKKKGVARRTNLVVTGLFAVAFTVIGSGIFLTAALSGLLPLYSGSRPVNSYEWNGQKFDIYDDAIPLEVEDLADVRARWSRKADYQETFLLSLGEYRQDPLFTENVGSYALEYKIIDVKVPALYNFIKNRLINSRHDEVHENVIFVDHYEPADPTLWNAREVYQLHWSDSVLNTYLVCWESRIAEIRFYWEPAPEQIQTAAQILEKSHTP